MSRTSRTRDNYAARSRNWRQSASYRSGAITKGCLSGSGPVDKTALRADLEQLMAAFEAKQHEAPSNAAD